MASVYSLKIADVDGKKQLTFSGDLVINHADKVVAEVKNALAQPSDTAVVIDNPNNIDMTFIQLLVAIKHSCVAANKKFEISSTLKEDLKLLIVKSGFDKEFNIA